MYSDNVEHPRGGHGKRIEFRGRSGSTLYADDVTPEVRLPSKAGPVRRVNFPVRAALPYARTSDDVWAHDLYEHTPRERGVQGTRGRGRGRGRVHIIQDGVPDVVEVAPQTCSMVSRGRGQGPRGQRGGGTLTRVIQSDAWQHDLYEGAARPPRRQLKVRRAADNGLVSTGLSAVVTIENLAEDLTAEEVRAVCQAYGSTTHCLLLAGHADGRAAAAEVSFRSRRDAVAAVKQLEGSMLDEDGHVLRCYLGTRRPDPPIRAPRALKRH
eukprot:NODE_3239_length_1004_cov_22.027366_g3093_i0.p1 GENE.NODE_3239_length_1004_cov_22.027366_g3093_i0~~NODE_3239_length_1004_cov_22.027366_g3093_i0.p1  ORF type:complete len:288 (-),score=49.52 NODE_3239_length_1004_cov_22.027366_g3093_i0:139-942(-)